jgi:hypothetical protein
MADIDSLRLILRRKLSQFLVTSGEVGDAVSVLKKWEQKGWGPILFGGVIRDLMIFGTRQYPRDVDVVLTQATNEEVIRDVGPEDFHLNRFGGLHMNIHRWIFDVWPLRTTWRFTVDKTLLPTPENLPRTTFFDVEAIAVTLDGPEKIGDIFTAGFFEAIEKRCIDINYRNNPYPTLCAVRTIIMAWKLHYHISARLAHYFIDTVLEYGASELVLTQKQHYKQVLLQEREIDELKSYFIRAVASNSQTTISLPDKYDPKQLVFWSD